MSICLCNTAKPSMCSRQQLCISSGTPSIAVVLAQRPKKPTPSDSNCQSVGSENRRLQSQPAETTQDGTLWRFVLQQAAGPPTCMYPLVMLLEPIMDSVRTSCEDIRGCFQIVFNRPASQVDISVSETMHVHPSLVKPSGTSQACNIFSDMSTRRTRIP